MAAPAIKTEAAEALLGAHAAPAGEARWVSEARAAARKRFGEMGAPHRRDEYWKFTRPDVLTAPEPATAAIAEAVEGQSFDSLEALRLVFVDGVFRPDLSDEAALEGVEIQPLSEAAATDIHWAKDVFGVLEARGQTPVPRPLAALNTVAASEGFVIRVTGKAAKPINLRYLRERERADAMIRVLVKVESGAALTLLENGPAAARLNHVIEAEVAEDARLDHIRVQGRDHERAAATHIFARLARESIFRSFTLTVNGKLTRNECVVEFAGDDALGHVAGASVGDGAFHHDDTVFVTHDAERCESRQVFKKVLRNGARGVFQGKILVKPHAQKTDGYQISQALLLDEDSEFNAKPELEIYADDVACSHGSTSGAVDETALFYLRSRGVPMVEAQNMLVLAFIDEAVREIEDDALADEIRERIGAWIARRSAA